MAYNNTGAVAFNGTNQNVQITLPETLTVNATIEGWFLLDSPEGGSNVLLRDNSGTASVGWILWLTGSTIGFRVAGRTYDTGVSSLPYKGEWVHIALVKEGAAVRYFLNGEKIYESVAGAANTANSSPWHIGKNGTNSQYIGGKADEVRFWRVARTDSEIVQNYDMVLDEAPEGLIASFRFDEAEENRSYSQFDDSIYATLVNNPPIVEAEVDLKGAAIIVIDEEDKDAHVPKHTNHEFNFKIIAPSPSKVSERIEMAETQKSQGRIYSAEVELMEWETITRMGVR